jgi:hypothetical protein
MAEITLLPSADLTQTSLTTVRPNRFILFTDSWLNLQNYIQTCLQLPISVQDFEKSYGTFEQKSLVTGAFDAMNKLKGLTTDFGNPTILKKKIVTDPSYLFTPTAPSEIYSHIVWLAMQIQNTANTFQFTFASLKDVIGPGAGTKEERAQNLRDILIGPGGLVSLAEEMKAKTTALISKLAIFEGKITDANVQMVTYTSQQSDILKAANRLVGEYTDKINNELKPASDAAWKAWRDFTIAAVTVSVGLAAIGCLMVALAPVTFGATGIAGMGLIAGGVIAAGVLGDAAAKQRALYNSLLDQIDTAEAAKKQKVTLVSDLTGLNGQISLVGQGLSDFKSNLAVIEGIWLDIGGKLAYICANYTVDQLSNLPWVTQTFKIMDAQNKWGEISTTTQEFTQNSLVDYRQGKFGDRVAEPQSVTA